MSDVAVPFVTAGNYAISRHAKSRYHHEMANSLHPIVTRDSGSQKELGSPRPHVLRHGKCCFGSMLQPVAPQLSRINPPSPCELYKYLKNFIFGFSFSYLVLLQCPCLILVLEIGSLATRQIEFIQNETAPMVNTPQKAIRAFGRSSRSYRDCRSHNVL